MTLARNPLFLSTALHLSLVLVGLALYFGSQIRLPGKKVDFEVIVAPKVAPANLQLQPKVKAEPPPPKPVDPPRQVFGVSRKAITVTDSSPNAAEVKQGNTIAKEQDNLKLNANDADSLPIPADDYLVSQMPKLKSEFRIPYPEAAKKASVEGPVVMDLLIDKEGRVRKVEVIKGPGFGLNEAAAEALMKFEFSPAKMGADAVAVKIRYTYRFVLEGG